MNAVPPTLSTGNRKYVEDLAKRMYAPAYDTSSFIDDVKNASAEDNVKLMHIIKIGILTAVKHADCSDGMRKLHEVVATGKGLVERASGIVHSGGTVYYHTRKSNGVGGKFRLFESNRGTFYDHLAITLTLPENVVRHARDQVAIRISSIEDASGFLGWCVGHSEYQTEMLIHTVPFLRHMIGNVRKVNEYLETIVAGEEAHRARVKEAASEYVHAKRRLLELCPERSEKHAGDSAFWSCDRDYSSSAEEGKRAAKKARTDADQNQAAPTKL